MHHTSSISCYYPLVSKHMLINTCLQLTKKIDGSLAAGVLQYSSFLFFHFSFCKWKVSSKENLQSHFKFLLKTYWRLPMHITPGSDSLSLCCGYSLYTYSQLSSSAGCYIWVHICSFSYHILGYKVCEVKVGLCFLQYVTALEIFHYKMRG